MPSSENRFLLEADGFTGLMATEVTAPGLKHTPVKYQPGNQLMPILVRGQGEVEEMTFKHARAVGSQGKQLVKWLTDHLRNRAVTTRNFRFLTMSEDGSTVAEEWELLDCMPTMYKPDQSSGTGTNVATFSFSIQPSHARLI